MTSVAKSQGKPDSTIESSAPTTPTKKGLNVLNRKSFNRHALPGEIKEIVKPVPTIPDRLEESPTKASQGLQNAGLAAIKSGILKTGNRLSRTEQSSPVGYKTADYGRGGENDNGASIKNDSGLDKNKSPKQTTSKYQKVEETAISMKPLDYSEIGSKYINDLRQELRTKEI